MWSGLITCIHIHDKSLSIRNVRQREISIPQTVNENKSPFFLESFHLQSFSPGKKKDRTTAVSQIHIDGILFSMISRVMMMTQSSLKEE